MTALGPNTVYTARIAATATDLAGNPMAAATTWTFTTGAALDLVAPRVTFTVPSNNATQVPVGTQVSVAFTKEMDPATITTSSFIVQQLGEPVVGTISYRGVTAVFTPTTPLAIDTTYSAVVTTQATDLAGNALMRNTSWSFSTGAVIDATGPMVLITLPADLDTDVLLNTTVSATFNEVMDPLSITDTVFTLEDAEGPVLGTVTQIDATGTFAPDEPLAADTTGTCMGDGSPCSAINPIINGTLYINDPEGIAAKAKVDLVAAYVEAMSRPRASSRRTSRA